MAGFFGVAVALMAARSDYDPVRRYISEYAVGPGGWLMRAGFALLGVASLNLVPGFLTWPGAARARARRVAGALAVWGAAVVTAAVFRVDLQGTAVTGTGTVHLVAAAVGFVALFLALAWAGRPFRETAGWNDLARSTRWVAVLAPVAFLMEATVFSTLGWVGVGQWVLFGLGGGWLLAVGRRFHVVAAPGRG